MAQNQGAACKSKLCPFQLGDLGHVRASPSLHLLRFQMETTKNKSNQTKVNKNTIKRRSILFHRTPQEGPVLVIQANGAISPSGNHTQELVLFLFSRVLDLFFAFDYIHPLSFEIPAHKQLSALPHQGQFDHSAILLPRKTPCSERGFLLVIHFPSLHESKT